MTKFQISIIKNIVYIFFSSIVNNGHNSKFIRIGMLVFIHHDENNFTIAKRLHKTASGVLFLNYETSTVLPENCLLPHILKGSLRHF